MSKSHAGRYALAVGILSAACQSAPVTRPQPRLTGIGIVAGLNSSGAMTAAARNAILHQMQAQGMHLDLADIDSGSVALVRLSCLLPRTATVGETTDVRCEAVDAGVSLRGGQLLRTELRDEDGITYVVAAGALLTRSDVADSAATAAATTSWVRDALFIRSR